MTKLTVRATASPDMDALLQLQKRVYPSIAPWRRDQLAHQLAIFPQGQLVAVLDQLDWHISSGSIQIDGDDPLKRERRF